MGKKNPGGEIQPGFFFVGTTWRARGRYRYGLVLWDRPALIRPIL